MNVTMLIGRLIKDPVIRYGSGSQTAIASFTLAVDRFGKEKNSDFIRCKAFGKTAETIEKYVNQGDQLGVQGRIETGSYQNKNGDTVFTTDVIVERMDFGQKSKRQTEKHEEQIDGFEALSEDVPF